MRLWEEDELPEEDDMAEEEGETERERERAFCFSPVLKMNHAQTTKH
jgi:hypothetical protein